MELTTYTGLTANKEFWLAEYSYDTAQAYGQDKYLVIYAFNGDEFQGETFATKKECREFIAELKLNC